MVFLDVFIGLFFLYVLLSLFASIIHELLSGIVSLRGKILTEALARFLGFESPKERFVFKMFLKTANPSYKKLMSTNLGIKRYPSYLTKTQLIGVLQDLYNTKNFMHEKLTGVPLEEDFNKKLIKDNLSLLNPLNKDLPLKKLQEKLEKEDEPIVHSQALVKYFWFRSLLYNYLYPLAEFFRRNQRNETLVVDNLNWFDHKINPNKIPDKNLRNHIDLIIHEFDANVQINKVDLNKAKDDLFLTYEDYMGRARGWFKRRVQFNLILIGFIMAFYTNADTVAIYNTLSTNPLARKSAVSMAESFVQSGHYEAYEDKLETIRSMPLDSLSDYDKKFKQLDELYVDILVNEFDTTKNLLNLGWDKKVLKPDYCDCTGIHEFATISANIWNKMTTTRFKFWVFFLQL